jgi:hypothetical protein
MKARVSVARFVRKPAPDLATNAFIYRDRFGGQKALNSPALLHRLLIPTILAAPASETDLSDFVSLEMTALAYGNISANTGH